MEYFVWVAPWVLASVCVGLMVGYYFANGRAKEPQQGLERDRKAVLQVLADLLGSAERLTSDVECHNTQIQAKARFVGDLHTSGEMEDVKHALLGQMEGLLLLNMRLQNEIRSNRYEMEERASALDEARREARMDALTAVANRKAFDEKFHVMMMGWERHRSTFTLVLIDLDHFKRINDAHGHPAGDRVLHKVGGWLHEWAREGDFVARYGGDEFAMLLPDTDLEAGMRLAERLCEGTAERASEISVAGGQVSVSLSIGVATVREGDTPQSLLSRADQGMYKSKRLGRNQAQKAEEPPREEVAQEATACCAAQA